MLVFTTRNGTTIPVAKGNIFTIEQDNGFWSITTHCLTALQIDAVAINGTSIRRADWDTVTQLIDDNIDEHGLQAEEPSEETLRRRKN